MAKEQIEREGGRSLTRRTLNAIAPDPAHATVPRRVGGALLGGAAVAGIGAGVAGVTELAVHSGLNLAATEPYGVAVGATAVGVFLIAGVATAMVDGTAAGSAEERELYAKVAVISRRVQAGSTRVALGTAVLAAAADVSGVAGGAHTGGAIFMATAVVGGIWAGAGVARAVAQNVAKPDHSLGE